MSTQIKNITTIHKGKYRDLVSAEFVTPRGTVEMWDYFSTSRKIAMVLPLTQSGAMVLVDEYRVPIDDRILSLPAGTFDSQSESAIECARRELQEETGYTAKELYSVTTFFGAPSLSNSQIELFVAFDVEKTSETHLDDNEDIVVCEYAYDKIKEMLSTRSRNIHPNIFAAYEMARIKFPERFSI